MTLGTTEALKILIVEDDSVDGKILERLLYKSSLHIAQTTSANCLAAALQLLRKDRYDIVLLDLGLPDAEGEQAFTTLQAHNPGVPIIVLSGLDDEDMATRAVQKGVQDYFVKGRVDGDLLTRSVRYAIERKKAEHELAFAEQRYRTIFENSAVAITMADEQEHLVSWNHFTEDLLGMDREDLYLRPITTLYPESEWRMIRALNIREKGVHHHLETKMIKKNGEVIDVDIMLSMLKDAEGATTGSIAVIRDITRHKHAEWEQQLSSHILEIANRHREGDTLFEDLVAEIQRYSGCAAVGIRMLDEDGNIPYEAYTGFSEHFYKSESPLSVKVDQCMCIDVIKGSTNPELPFFTAGGSFYMNATTRFLATIPEEKKGRTRNVCNEAGYESVALIPILLRHRVCGLIHLADTRENMVHLGMVHALERIARQLGVALERIHTQEALRRSEERFRQVVENAEEWIWEVDTDGVYTYASPIVGKILGYKPEELLGKKQLFDLFHPEDREELREKVLDIFSRKEMSTDLTVRSLHKTGKTVWLSMSGVPILHKNQNLAGYRGVAVDITERARLHEILDHKQKNLEAIFDAAPLGMLLVREDMRIKRANDAIRRMVGREYSEIIDQLPGPALGCVHVVGESTSGRYACGVGPACEACSLVKTVRGVLDLDQSVHGVEIQTTFEIGRKKTRPWLSVSAEPVIIDGKKHAVVAINDITDRKRAEEELRETMEIKSQIISTVSHELRTPLASMKEAVLIVLNEVAGKISKDQRRFLDIARRNIERLARLINDVLDFQKLGSGQMEFCMQENDIGKVVEDAYNTMVPYSQKTGVNLAVKLEDSLPKAVFDSDRIIQAVTNLVSNAIKFTPQGGLVSVCVRRQDRALAISVTDTGMGIPKEALPKIFDRFYRVQRPGREIKGTGLGLAIVKSIVMGHGGRIDVESELEKGTTFTVVLPLVPKARPQALPETADQSLEEALVNN